MVKGYTQREFANRIGMSVATVNKRVMEGRIRKNDYGRIPESELNNAILGMLSNKCGNAGRLYIHFTETREEFVDIKNQVLSQLGDSEVVYFESVDDIVSALKRVDDADVMTEEKFESLSEKEQTAYKMKANLKVQDYYKKVLNTFVNQYLSAVSLYMSNLYRQSLEFDSKMRKKLENVPRFVLEDYLVFGRVLDTSETLEMNIEMLENKAKISSGKELEDINEQIRGMKTTAEAFKNYAEEAKKSLETIKEICESGNARIEQRFKEIMKNLCLYRKNEQEEVLAFNRKDLTPEFLLEDRYNSVLYSSFMMNSQYDIMIRTEINAKMVQNNVNISGDILKKNIRNLVDRDYFILYNIPSDLSVEDILRLDDIVKRGIFKTICVCMQEDYFMSRVNKELISRIDSYKSLGFKIIFMDK